MNAKYKLTVSEPWDFNSPAGNSIIIGEVVKIMSSKRVIFRSDNLLSFDGYNGDLLVLTSRFDDQILTKEDNFEGTVNGALVLTDKYEEFDENELENVSKYVLVGRLEKE